MKLTIEDGEDTTIADVRHVSITDTRHVAEMWWEEMDGQKFTLERTFCKPRRIVLEFEEE